MSYCELGVGGWVGKKRTVEPILQESPLKKVTGRDSPVRAA